MSASVALDASLNLNIQQTALSVELDAYDEVTIRHDARALPEAQRAMWRLLQDVAETVEELYSLQLHPQSLEWRDKVKAEGSALDVRLVTRHRLPWCAANTLPVCAALPSLPPRSVADGLWGGSGLTARQVESLSREINGMELLSPFTVVTKRPDGGFEAVSYARSELLGPKMARLHALLEQVAGIVDSKSLASFLRSRAQSLRADEPFPYDESDLQWLAVDGDIEMTVGPYESYDDPHGFKAMFTFIAGRRNTKVEAEAERFATELREAEEALGLIVGEPIRDPRVPMVLPIIRAVDAWLVSGQARCPTGALSAYHLPNRGAAAEAGRGKKVLLTNHLEVLSRGLSHMARGVLGESGARGHSFEAAILGALFHEFAHGIGPGPSTRVRTATERDILLGQALGPEALSFEELKAMVVAVWLAEHFATLGKLSSDQVEGLRATAVAQAFELSTYPSSEPHARAAAAFFHALEKRGALVRDEGKRQVRVVADAWGGAIESMARELLISLLRADKAGLRAWRADSREMRDLAFRAQAGHRPASLVYAIDGI